ncbi:hypothetical protein [Pseudonocardia lacus]|uniref:hypothetical protein n=1 Tax=Pseudonocardia lacus TaxID=2835865 RepID=UPI001BDC7E1D|nr:hypothetical protein [Pseudonocardia lacus]
MDESSRVDALVAALRGIERDARGLVTLVPGIAHGVMDGWPVTLPEGIRALFREVGGIRVKDWEEFLFTRHCADVGECTHCLRAGGGAENTFWVVHTNAAAETYYVDVDPQSGRWGPSSASPRTRRRCARRPTELGPQRRTLTVWGQRSWSGGVWAAS